MARAGAEIDKATNLPKGWQPTLVYAPQRTPEVVQTDVDRIAGNVMNFFGVRQDVGRAKGSLDDLLGAGLIDLPNLYQDAATGKYYSDIGLTQEVTLPPGATFVPDA